MSTENQTPVSQQGPAAPPFAPQFQGVGNSQAVAMTPHTQFQPNYGAMPGVPPHAAGQYGPASFQSYSPATPAATVGLQSTQITPIVEQGPYVPRINPTTGQPFTSVWRERHDEEKKRSAALEAEMAAIQKAKNDLYQELLAARAETAEAKRATEFERKLSAVKSGDADSYLAAGKGKAIHFEEDDSPERKREKKKRSKRKSKKGKGKRSRYSSSDSSSSSESDSSSKSESTSDSRKQRRKRQRTKKAAGAAAVRKAASIMTASGATSPPPSKKSGGLAGAAALPAKAKPGVKKMSVTQVGRTFKTQLAKAKLKLALVQFKVIKPEEALGLKDEEAVKMAATAHRDGAVELSLFGSLIFMLWMGESPRWWLRRFAPWWNVLSVGELRDWYREADKYGTYVLASVLTRRTYVGKFWSGSRERLTKHIECVLKTEKRGGRKLYGFLRAAGVHNFFMLPLATYRSKGDCDADERLIISQTQRLENTLNTVGVRRRNTSAYRRRHRRRRVLTGRKGATPKNMWTRASCAGDADLEYSMVSCDGYEGSRLDQALRRLSKRETLSEGNWQVDYKAGSWNCSDWAKLKLRYGSSKVRLSSTTRELRGTLRELLPVLKREDAKLMFSSIEVSTCDEWALGEIKRLRVDAFYTASEWEKLSLPELLVQADVHLVCLLRKNKFAFLAPQSALGFKDRSKAARFDVSILLIQNRAAARLKPVTRQGLARVERAFGAAVDDRRVCYSAEWGVGFSWQLEREVRNRVHLFEGERRVLARFEKLMKCDVTAGMLFQNAGGELMRAVGSAKSSGEPTGMRSLSEYREAVGLLKGLARGVLDRNTAVGFGICEMVYQRWLRGERDGGNYEISERQLAEVVGGMQQRYRAAGLTQVATFDLAGNFGNLYLMPKHKDPSLLEKRRPVVPGFGAPDRVLQNRIGRGLCFLLGEISGHFNVGATQEIGEKLREFNAALDGGGCVMAAGFDVKEMYVRLTHTQALRAAEYVVSEVMGEEAILVNTRGRKGVRWYEPGTPRKAAVKITREQILAGVQFILGNGFLFVAGTLVRQTCGIGIGGKASPGLAQCVCVYGEMQWLSALKAEGLIRRRDTLVGVRLMDDCTLLLAAESGSEERMKKVFRGYVRDCYPEGMMVEQTSEGLEWTFCGMQLTVTAGGVCTRVLQKNVAAGVSSGDQLQFFPLVAYASDCPKARKMASTLNVLFRIERHSLGEGEKLAAIVDLARELQWQGYPEGWLHDALVGMVSRVPFGFWNSLVRRLSRGGVRL
ncbi:hypothetical protein CYMTET_28635 [Cymbomonas tetramitiformis]|uniref:Uncharacterized protein n=1 Tax=Cymbomonas tetramitiformis TaxID=36881 RepID=A0AAE0KVR3_9CHLO|nr:hypothetical protein CYMTET_28635 [Cymbomonas tetramitiformis]